MNEPGFCAVFPGRYAKTSGSLLSARRWIGSLVQLNSAANCRSLTRRGRDGPIQLGRLPLLGKCPASSCLNRRNPDDSLRSAQLSQRAIFMIASSGPP